MRKPAGRLAEQPDPVYDTEVTSFYSRICPMSESNLSEMYDNAVRQKDEGNLEGAVESLQEIVKFDDNHVHSHMALGVYLQRLGRLEEAIKHATRVTEIDPNDPFSFTQLSVILQRCNRIPEACLLYTSPSPRDS